MHSILQHKNIFLKDYAFHFASSTFTHTERYALHAHDFYEFTIVEEGILRQTFNSQRIDLNKYSLCLIKPDDIHAVASSPKCERVRIFNIAITSQLFHKAILFLNIDYNQESTFKEQISMDEWLSIYAKIQNVNKMYHSKDHRFLEIYIKELIIDLLVALLSVPEPEKQAIPPWLSQAYEKMQEPKYFLVGLTEFISLSDKSQEHLNRSMKKYYGMTPTAFINQQRLQYAARLLSSSEKTISDIIYQSGFDNASHFSRLFKQYFNLTPRKYRVKNKNIYNPD